MQIFLLLIICSVIGFHPGFLKFLFRGFLLMDCWTCLKHLALDYELGCGFSLFGSFNQVSTFLGMFLLFGFGLMLLYSDGFSRHFFRFLCDLRGKSGELRRGSCSKFVLGENGKCGLLKFWEDDESCVDEVEQMKEKSNPKTDSGEKINTVEGEDDEENKESEYTEEDIVEESDVSMLRKLLKIERHRAEEALSELAKERAASATAAEEAMAMILRLQNEKSLIEMESSQYRRLAEEKQIHDQEVIQSLQWLVWRHESERSLLEEQLKSCKQQLKRFSKIDECEEAEEAQSPFKGNILDALENVLYSSRDVNKS